MNSLKVLNSWEKLTWSLNGAEVDPESIDRVLIHGKVFKARGKFVRHNYSEQGQSRLTEVHTLDIELNIPLPFKSDAVELEVWISLYKNKPVRDLVSRVYLKGESA